MIGDYKRSKFMAEQLVIEAARGGQDVVMVNPTTPIGERDIKPTPTGQIIVDFLKRKFPAYVDTGLNLLDVLDCAEGHLLALEKARPGERYILGGENLTLKQILDKLAAITGLPSPKIELPYAVAYATGVVDTLVTGQVAQARAPRNAGRRSHGPQEDVRQQRESRARVGMESRAGGQRIATGGGLVPRQRICLSRSRSSRPCAANSVPLLRGATKRKRDGVELYELPSALVAIGGIGRNAGTRAAELVVREANPEVVGFRRIGGGA